MNEMNEGNEYTVLSMIRSMDAQFTKTDWKIAHFIMNHTAQFIESSALDIAAETKSSDASVIRFAQKLGFDGFYELRMQCKKELEAEREQRLEDDDSRRLEYDYLELTKKLFALNPPSRIHPIAQSIIEKRTVYIVCFKDYKYLSQIAAARFLALGIQVIPLSSMSELRLAALRCDKDTFFLILTTSAYQESLAQQLKLLKDQGASFATLTDELQDFPNLQHECLTIPAPFETRSGYVISFASLVLTLFDMIYDAVYETNPYIFAQRLRESLSLSSQEDQ